MSSTIITKNSSTASAVPLAGDLVKGELAVNVTDRKIYTKDNSGSVVLVSSISALSEGIIRVARTSNTALTSNNRGSLIDITSGTFTQTFDACSSLEDGWFCYIKNSGTGDITLDPNSSETIDGLTSFVMYPQEARLVQCDGTALRTIVLNSFARTFTANGTFTKPPGYNAFDGLLWGGGGSGAKNTGSSGGGGGGACVPFVLQSSAVGSSVAVTIGAAVTGPSTSNTTGVQGNNSTFGSLVTAYGGAGGFYDSFGSLPNTGGGGGGALSQGGTGSVSNQGGFPSISVTLDADNNGFGGGSGGSGSSNAGGYSAYGGGGGGFGAGLGGGGSLYGGGGGGGNTTGGTSVYGGAGGSGSTTGPGSDGTAPGGGGGGTNTGTKAGNGARGELRIRGVL